MKCLLLFIFSAIILHTTAYSQFYQSGDSTDFKKLMAYSKLKHINNDQFARALVIVKRLDKKHSCEYNFNISSQSDSFLVSLPVLFYKICAKYNNINGVQEFFNYIDRNHGSADELISTSFYELFVKQPGFVLEELTKRNDTKPYFGHLLMGISYEWNYNKIDTQNYKDVFLNLNPDLKKLQPKYQPQIDSILVNVKKMLEQDQRYK